MKIYIQAADWQRQEILSKEVNNGVELIFSQEQKEIPGGIGAAFMCKNDSADYENFYNKFHVPLFINEVSRTLNEIPGGDKYCRINGWPGFLERPLWEASAVNSEIFEKILSAIGWEAIFVEDVPGFVSARIISQVINEAYYALQENVSTKEEIDMAMKLGTNYPYGPFEWANKIGINRVHELLLKLSLDDEAHNPSFLPGNEFSL